VIAAAPGGTDAYSFRTAAGVEIDLLLKLPGHRNPGRTRSGAASPKLERGFHLACDTDRRRVVYDEIERFPLDRSGTLGNRFRRRVLTYTTRSNALPINDRPQQRCVSACPCKTRCLTGVAEGI
jgi:hypothetical protein